MKNKINTFIIGAQKAGTTSLYDWLDQHLDVQDPNEIKDYHFFTREPLYKKGINHLESFYSNQSKIQLHGAVNYMYFSEVAAERIYDYNPQAKIIICLRDPIKRAISAYQYFIRTLREKNSFEKALRLELDRKLKTEKEFANNTYIGHGDYVEQINTYLKYFKREQFHFVFFEELIDSTKQKSVLIDICDFLNIENNFQFQFTHLNASGQPKSKTLNYIIRKSGLSKTAKYFLPFNTRKKLGKKIEQNNISTKKLEVEIRLEDIELLSSIYKNQIINLSELLNKDLTTLWK